MTATAMASRDPFLGFHEILPFSPKSPEGLMISTMAMSRKAKDDGETGEIKRIPKEESCPMRKDATTAPTRLPSPPVTVTTKQSTRISPAMPG